MSGDISISADIAFLSDGGNRTRKAVLMIRQSLDADSPYADVARPRRGLTSLQFRDTKAGDTHEVQSNVASPQRVRLEKRGDYFYLYRCRPTAKGPLQPAGASIRWRSKATVLRRHRRLLARQGCRRESRLLERGTQHAAARDRRTHVSTARSKPCPSPRPTGASCTSRRAHFEAPNWTRDGSPSSSISDGRIERLPVAGGTPTRHRHRRRRRTATTTTASRPTAAARHQRPLAARPTVDASTSLPIAGGTPRRITPEVALLLARLVARRQDARLRRPARRRVRHLYHSRCRRRRDAPHHRRGTRRRPRVFARRPVHLFQLRAHRHHADLAHACRRQQTRNRSLPTSSTTGSRTSRPTASGWSSSVTKRRHRPSAR